MPDFLKAETLVKRALRKWGYSPHRAPLAPTSTRTWALQAQRHLKVYHETLRHVRNLSIRSNIRPPAKVNAAPAPGVAPKGFGGSGYSGSPAQNLGAPQIQGSVTPPPPAPIS